MKKPKLNLTVTEESKRLLAELAAKRGLSQSAVVETLIRDAARKDRVK